mgnify:CR=1 FL=1
MATRLNRPRPKPGKSSNKFAVLMGIIALVLFLVPMLVGLYTDFRWFGELDYRGVFTTTILARIVLFLAFAALGAAITWAAAFFAWRGRDRDSDFAVLSDPNSPMTLNRAAIQSGIRPLVLWVPLAVGLVSGLLGQGAWRTFLLLSLIHI